MILIKILLSTTKGENLINNPAKKSKINFNNIFYIRLWSILSSARNTGGGFTSRNN